MIIVIINMITIVIIRWNVYFASALAFLCVVGGLGGPHTMFVRRWQGPAGRECPGRAPNIRIPRQRHFHHHVHQHHFSVIIIIIIIVTIIMIIISHHHHHHYYHVCMGPGL